MVRWRNRASERRKIAKNRPENSRPAVILAASLLVAGTGFPTRSWN
jgi:hypothetical protein